MAWRELMLSPVRRSELDALTTALFAMDCAGTQEDHVGQAPEPPQPWDELPMVAPPDPLTLKAWFDGVDEKRLTRQIRAIFGGTLTFTDVPDTDWSTSWQVHHERFQVGDLVVAPPWDASPGALIIEPGRGFGTGAHPTTRAALHAVEALAPSARRALDVGCGSGILALAAARHGVEVLGIDIEEAAITAAREHAALNGLRATFETTPIAAIQQPADLVLGNLHAELIETLAEDLLRLTSHQLVLAGILVDREHKVRAAIPLDLVARHADGEWVCLWYRR